jgi:ABC-type Fe3+/spermidine/putrescine transport system ATPase subunit
VRIGAQDVTDLPPHRRRLGMVFQNYALLPHMTVAANVGLGLRLRGVPRAVRARKVAQALEMVGLPETASRYPRALSGGQQQRVGLARAIAAEPQLMLLDEPLSNLDARLREQMCLEIADLQRRLGMTLLYVTHDQGEALAMSDRIAIMQAGRIREIGTPAALYRRPASRMAAEFLGEVNVLDPPPGGAGPAVALRPEAILVERPGSPRARAAAETRLDGVIERLVYRGAHSQVLIRVPGLAAPLLALLPHTDAADWAPATGERVVVSWRAGDAHPLRAT